MKLTFFFISKVPKVFVWIRHMYVQDDVQEDVQEDEVKHNVISYKSLQNILHLCQGFVFTKMSRIWSKFEGNKIHSLTAIF